MILTTTPTLEGKPVKSYLGIVAGEAIMGANIFRDMFAGIRDIVGGRSGSYETVFRDARAEALRELAEEAKAMGADAVIGIQLSSNAVGASDSMLMVSATGTAVKLY
ncbi:heavy metal-binding domain-containing protein [Sandaracinobacteroides saxicola]|uniref:UPF0145 protein H3309_12690 n=1 Tax=Sandaracinobacteroides saxicola TaxID=2759707 RepID=A0A7G5IFS2_9SPHN|nr:heavy metal-binding domain-containing protein [Sandaracinobacteroides saxicola]QMW22214.1 heavy metal-binding domain-containing protein [Sandaracinobacteroides saxicola]